MSWDDDIYTCEVCGIDQCVPAHGNPDSPVLIVGEFPGNDEVLKGVPLVGRTGTIMRQQLAHLGWDLSQFRVMNLWIISQITMKNVI